MGETILSIDLGTMGVKIALVNLDGIVEAVAYREYPIISEVPGQAEQNPTLWWNGLIDGMKKLKETYPELSKRVVAISLCGQMHTHVYLNRKGEPLGNALTWLDQRSATIIEDWKLKGITDKLFEATWNAPTTTYTAPQVCWVRKNKKELFEKTRHILIAKDYIKYLLTKNMVTDPSDASGTALFDIRTNNWSNKAFELIGLSKDLFPEVLPSTTIIGTLTKEASKLMGLSAGIPVVNGGSDHSVAEIGSGMLKEGTVSCIIGTAGVVAACSSKPVQDHKKRVMCWSYPLEGYWDVLGVTQTAASSLTWFRNTFDPEASDKIFEKYSELAENVPQGAEGLIFLPYLMGERTPHWNSKARGVFFGLRMNHNKAHMIRAIMEGVAYSIKDCVEVFRELGINFDSVSVMGGGSKSKVWRKILADVLGKEVRTLEVQDTSAIGNLILAGFATGLFKNHSDVELLIRHRDSIFPNQENIKKYEKNFIIYRKIYNKTKSLMAEMEE